MKKQNKGFIVPLLIAIIAVLAIGGGIYVYENKKAEPPLTIDTSLQIPTQTEQSNSQSESTGTTQDNSANQTTQNISSISSNTIISSSVSLSNSDIEAITTAVQNFKQAFLNNDEQGVLEYSSVATQNTLKINQLNTSFKDITIKKIAICDSSCRPYYYTNNNEVSVTLATISTSGVSGSTVWGFVKEGGVWKFDLGLTTKLAQTGSSASVSSDFYITPTFASVSDKIVAYNSGFNDEYSELCFDNMNQSPKPCSGISAVTDFDVNNPLMTFIIPSTVHAGQHTVQVCGIEGEGNSTTGCTKKVQLDVTQN